MSTEPASPPAGTPRAATPAVTEMVRRISSSWGLAESRLPEMGQEFYGLLFTLAPDLRELFPVNMDGHQGAIVRGLVRKVLMVDRPAELVPYLRQLGRDYRKYCLEERHYEAVGVALLAAIREQLGGAWTQEVEQAWAEGYTIVARTMLEAAAADTRPALVNAVVTDHRRLSWDLAMVRVEPEERVAFRPGQFLSVQVPQRPRLWRYFSPANAPREDGSLEFHVRAVENGWVSRAIVGYTRPGDIWQLGPSLGRLRIDRGSGRKVLLIAGGTGLAPLASLVDDLARYGKNPQVTMFVGGRTPDDLYVLSDLQRLAAANPWLRLVPVVEQGDVPGAERGTLAEAVTRRGAWPDHSVLISGSPPMIRATISRMLVAGTYLDQISYDPFSL